MLINTLSKFQFPDRPTQQDAISDVFIAAIYGFSGREHMRRNLLCFLRQAGYSNTTMYGHLQAKLISSDLEKAAAQGQKIVIIGYSQGGLEAVRVARELDSRGVNVALLVTIAAGGRGGRFWPHRWSDDPRSIPANVKRCLNYFSMADFLGTDPLYGNNLAASASNKSHVENIVFSKKDRVSHLAITKCYPESKVHSGVNAKLLKRIRKELLVL